jgi:phytoene dehydrogenase-like protein
MDTPAKAVVIVGGGLSGLTAAVQLARWGVSAALFDDATELGGRARTNCREGFHLNYGPHRLYEGGPAVRALRELNVKLDAAPRGPNGGFAVWRGRKFTLPVGCCSLLTTALVGARAKREIARLLTSLPTLRLEELEHLSIADWLRTRMHERDVVQLILAMVRYTTYCDDPEQQSASAAIDQLRLGMTRVLYIHHGWASLVASLRRTATAAGTEVLAGQRVVALNVAGGRAVSVVLADGQHVPAGSVIIATGPQTAERLLNGVGKVGVATRPIRVAALDVALRSLPNERAIFALGIDEPWCYSADSLIARVAPDRAAVVHLAKYLRGNSSGTPADEEQLERAMDLLQPGWRQLVVYRRFLPNVVVSHAIVSAAAGGFAGRTVGRVPGLSNVFLAGDWVGPIGQLADASVASGIEAARNAARSLDRSSDWYAAH